jgi:oligopeptidase B
MHNPDLLKPEIRNFLEVENSYQDAIMASTKPLQEKLYSEMRGRIKEDDSSVPFSDGQNLYGRKYLTGGQHPHLFRSGHDGSQETALLDGDKEADG